MIINLSSYKTNNRNRKINFNGIKIYDNIHCINKSVVRAFEPIFIKSPKFSRDIFLKNFSQINPKKRNFLHKFANINEHYHLMYGIEELQYLASLPIEKLKTLYKTAHLQSQFGLKRFSPEEVLSLSKLKIEELIFLSPFAREKKYNGLFNFSTEQLYKILKLSKEEKENAMLLLGNRIKAQDLINISKENSSNINALKKQIDTINSLFKNDIEEISIKKLENSYILSVNTNEDFRTHHYIFDNNFKLDKRYKSDIDFEQGTFKKNSILEKINFLKKHPQTNTITRTSNLRVSTKEHFYTLEKINEHLANLKDLSSKAYRHNCLVIYSGEGNFIKTEHKLPKNLLVNYWEKGAIDNNDLIRICSENIEMIPEEDLKYFALNKIKITNYDNEKYLEIRKNNYLSKPVEIGSEYYNKVLKEILNTEQQKLANIKTEKKLVIIDGFPGAGKSTIINKLLKKNKNEYYTPDADDIKAMFKDIYKNGEGAALVHKASSHILKQEILPIALAKGKNIIFQTTGDSIKTHKLIQSAKEQGYSIDFIHINTPIKTAIERTIARFKESGRFIDPYVVLSTCQHNNREKKYAAKIFSFNTDIKNTYMVEKGEIFLFKDGLKQELRNEI